MHEGDTKDDRKQTTVDVTKIGSRPNGQRLEKKNQLKKLSHSG